MEFACFATLLLLVIILCAPSKEQPSPPPARVRQRGEMPRQRDYPSYGEYLRAFEEAVRERKGQ